MRPKSFVKWLMMIVATGLLLRLILAWTVPPAFDIDAWQQHSNYWQEGKSPYENYGRGVRYKYSPLWFCVITAMSFFSRVTHMPFFFMIRLPLIFCDVLISILLIQICRKRHLNSQTSLAIFASFFLNPITIQTSGYSGQFDNLSLIFALLAWYGYVFRPKLSFVLSLIFMNISVAVKHFTMLIAPVFAFQQKTLGRKFIFLGATPALFLMSLLPYFKGNPHAVFRHVFQYNLHAGYWGWSGVICRSVLFFTGFDLIQQPWFKYMDYFNSFLYVAVIFASFWIVKRYDLLDSIIIVLLLFYVFTTQIAPHYTLWIIPFAVLKQNRFFYAYSIVGGFQIAAFFYCHHFWFRNEPFIGLVPNLLPETFVLFRYLTWVICVVWLSDYFGILKRFISWLSVRGSHI